MVAAAAKRNMTTVTVAVAPVPVPVAMVIRVIKCIDYDTVQYSVGLLLHTSAQFIRYEQYLRPHSIKVAPVAVAPVAVAPVPVDEEVPVPVVMVIRVHSSCGWSDCAQQCALPPLRERTERRGLPPSMWAGTVLRCESTREAPVS